MELLAQTCRCAWLTIADDGSTVVTSESPVIGPTYLARTNASTLFQALESACSFVSMEKLKDSGIRVAGAGRARDRAHRNHGHRFGTCLCSERRAFFLLLNWRLVEPLLGSAEPPIGSEEPVRRSRLWGRGSRPWPMGSVGLFVRSAESPRTRCSRPLAKPPMGSVVGHRYKTGASSEAVQRVGAPSVDHDCRAPLSFVVVEISAKELTRNVKWVSVVLNSDLCSANSRLKHAVGYDLSLHNERALDNNGGVVLLIDAACNAHIIHGIVEKTFALPKLIPKLYSVAFTLSVVKHLPPIFRALQKIVDEDLQLGFFPDTAPNPAHVRVAEQLIDMTILRPLVTRGRETTTHDVAHERRMRDLAATLKELLNGNWAEPTIQHYCHQPGCCANRDPAACRARIVSALAAAFIEPLSVKLPSTTRWWTFGPTLSAQAGGFLCHLVLPRVLRQALDPDRALNDETVGLAVDEQESWQVRATTVMHRVRMSDRAPWEHFPHHVEIGWLGVMLAGTAVVL